MKKLLKTLLSIACIMSVFGGMSAFAMDTSVERTESSMESTLTAEQIISENVEGFEINEISRGDLVTMYMNRYKVDKNLATSLVNKNYPNKARAVNEKYYVITKDYSLKFIQGGNIGSSAKHQVVVTMYSSGSFLEISNARDSCVLLNSSDYTWESGINTQDSTYNSVTWFSTGNLTYSSTYSLGAGFAGFLSTSTGGSYNYRKYFELSSKKTY